MVMCVMIAIICVFLPAVVVAQLPTDIQAWEIRTSAVLGTVGDLPCILKNPLDLHNIQLVLWYKQGSGIPIYTFDPRGAGFAEASHRPSHVALGKRAQYLPSADPSILRLQEVLAGDQGTYICRVDLHTGPTQYTKIHFNVIIPPRRPVILDDKGVQTTGEVGPFLIGRSLLISCLSKDGKPLPSLTWWYKGKLYDKTWELVNNGTIKNDLVIRPLKRQHLHATFNCRASNNNVTEAAFAVVRLTLSLRPTSVSILGISTPLSAGRTYEIQCQTKGSYPIPTINFILGGSTLIKTRQEVSKNKKTVLTTTELQVTPEHNGEEITCRVDHPDNRIAPVTKTARINVHYRPKVFVRFGPSLNPDNIRLGSDVYMECDVTSNPPFYLITWLHDDLTVKQNVRDGVILGNQTLVLQKVGRQSSGIYQCSARNSEGMAKSNALKLTVKYKPECSQNTERSYLLSAGEHALISCNVSAIPAPSSFRWVFNGSGSWNDMRNDTYTQDEYWSQLNFSSETHFENGNLLCWASNRVGEQEDPCVIPVIEADLPEALTNCSVTNVTAGNLLVDCMEDYNVKIPENYVLQVYEASSNKMTYNKTHSEPTFLLDELRFDVTYKLYLFAWNAKGKGPKTSLQVNTLKSVKTQMVLSGESQQKLPILVICVVAGGAVLFLSLLILLILKLHTSKQKPEKDTTSVSAAEDSTAQDPDVIPSVTESILAEVSSPEATYLSNPPGGALSTSTLKRSRDHSSYNPSSKSLPRDSSSGTTVIFLSPTQTHLESYV